MTCELLYDEGACGRRVLRACKRDEGARAVGLGMQTKSGSGRALGYAKAAVSAILFGMIAVLTGTLYAAGATGFEIVFWRMGVAALAVAVVCRARGVSLHIDRGKLPWMLCASVLYAFVILFLCLAYGTESSSGLMSTIYHTYPLVVMLASTMLFHRRPGVLKFVAAACALMGTAFALLSGEGWEFTLQGVGFALASAACYGLYSVVLERPELQDIPSLVLFLYGCLMGVVLCLPFVLLASSHLNPGLAQIGSLVLLGLACTAVPYLLYISAVREVGSTPVALLSYLEYPVTIGLLALSFGEMPGSIEVAGCVLIAGAGILTVLPERRPASASTASEGEK